MDRLAIIIALLLSLPIADFARAGECLPIAGADSLYQPGVAVLIGEIHGTDEGPATIRQLACGALTRGLSVTVGLEIPVEEQGRIDRYFAGKGMLTDRELLITGDFWQRDYQDGRPSQAVVQLIEALRQYNSDSTHRIRVIAFDNPAAEQGRDRYMAERLATAIAQDSAGFAIVLTGNRHNRLIPGSNFDPEYQPMGFWLWLLSPQTRIVSLELTHSGGSAWVCTGNDGCGVIDLMGIEAAEGVDLYPPADDEPYSGRIHVGRISASPPANEN